MTVIAWDGLTLAADKMVYYETSKAVTTKIYKFPVDEGHILVGWSGDCANGQEMLNWVKEGRIPEKFPICQKEAKSGALMVIEADGAIKCYFTGPFALKLEDSFHAIGSGDEFAMAALYLGYSAEVAVKTASALCPSCGNGIDTLTL
jgi:20S proteasome alpha/beta subunit